MRIFDKYDQIKESFSLFPILLSIGAIVLATGLIVLDEHIGQELGDDLYLIFGGTPAGARDLMAVIASAMVAIVAVTFSVTIVAIQQAASQYSSRILRNFIRDRSNQLVLGAYIATFIYALLVMRQIRESTENQSAFVPSVSITVGVLLAIVALGMLVFFIHHITLSLQVSTILAAIRSELYLEIDHLYPEQLGRGAPDAPTVQNVLERTRARYEGLSIQVRAGQAGYIRAINEDQVSNALKGKNYFGKVNIQVGEYVRTDGLLVSIWPEGPDELSKHHRHLLEEAFVFDDERSIRQDALFGIRQIVDIAVKALSPGISDPTTAEQCIYILGEIIGRLQVRSFPSPLRQIDDRVLIVFSRPDFDQYVEVTFAQIIDGAKQDAHVSKVIRAVLAGLMEAAVSESRKGTLRSWLNRVAEPGRNG